MAEEKKKKVPYKYRIVQNVSDAMLVISGLGGPDKILTLKRGEVIDLSERFKAEEVNSNNGIRKCIEKMGTLKPIEKMEDVKSVITSPIAAQMRAGDKIALDSTPYQHKLQLQKEMEELANLREKEKAGTAEESDLERIAILTKKFSNAETLSELRGLTKEENPTQAAQELLNKQKAKEEEEEEEEKEEEKSGAPRGSGRRKKK